MVAMEKKIYAYHEALHAWYKKHARDLPWRNTTDPYKILISEVMLQQTQVERVLPKYEAFLEAFPTVKHLAQASNADLLRLWSGLGYNSRALRLKAAAEEVCTIYGGIFPKDRALLQNMKGIGAYTSGAIMAFAYHASVSFSDTNIKRLVHRVFVGLELQGWKKSEKEIAALVEEVCDYPHAYEYHQALMDLGATVCRATKMSCTICPMKALCSAHKEIIENPLLLEEKRVSYKKSTVPFKESKRYIRGGIVEYLRQAHTVVPLSVLITFVQEQLRTMPAEDILSIVQDLEKEGLIVREEGGLRL